MDEDPFPPPPLAFMRRHDVHVFSDVGRLALGQRAIAAVATRVLRGEGCPGALLAIAFVSTRFITEENRRTLGHRGATDIITLQFGSGEPGAPAAGQVYIAPDVARRNAAELGVSLREELARLTIHGVLHVLGWTHPEGEGRESSPMWRRQETWLSRLGRDGVW